MHSSVCVSESQSLPGSYRQNSAHSRVSAQSPHSASGIRVGPLSEKREGGAWRGGLAGRFYTGAEFSGALVRALTLRRALRLRAEGARFPAAELLDRVLRAGCVCGTHLAVGGANAGHLLVEFNQFSLELLQLLPLGAHALVVFAAGRRLARCSWLPVPLATFRRISPPPTEAPLRPPIPHPSALFHLRVSISLGSYWREGQKTAMLSSHLRVGVARYKRPSL